MRIDKRKAGPKIAFVTDLDASNTGSHSGAPHRILQLLKKHFSEVDVIDKLRPNKMSIRYLMNPANRELVCVAVIERLKQWLWNVVGKKYLWVRSRALSKYYGKVIQSALSGKKYDLIFVEKTSGGIPYLHIDTPIVFSTDCTFKSLNNFYPQCTNLVHSASREYDQLEKAALTKAEIFICTSEWAANDAVNHYGLAREKIRVINRPGNLRSIPSREQALKNKRRDLCELLFMGIEWERKGGDIAAEVVSILNKCGLKASLSVCGCLPPKKYRDDSNKYPVSPFLTTSLTPPVSKLTAGKP